MNVDPDQCGDLPDMGMLATMFRHPLMRDLARLTVAKLAILGLIYALFFSPSHRQPIDPVQQIARSVLPPASPR
jgi:hypothetical protein